MTEIRVTNHYKLYLVGTKEAPVRMLRFQLKNSGRFWVLFIGGSLQLNTRIVGTFSGNLV